MAARGDKESFMSTSIAAPSHCPTVVISITFELASLLFIPILNIFGARKKYVNRVVNLPRGQRVGSGTL